MKKYCYSFNDSKVPVIKGNIQYFTRLIKEPTRLNKPDISNYMHIYQRENDKYVHIETRCLNYFAENKDRKSEGLRRMVCGF